MQFSGKIKFGAPSRKTWIRHCGTQVAASCHMVHMASSDTETQRPIIDEWYWDAASCHKTDTGFYYWWIFNCVEDDSWILRLNPGTSYWDHMTQNDWVHQGYVHGSVKMGISLRVDQRGIRLDWLRTPSITPNMLCRLSVLSIQSCFWNAYRNGGRCFCNLL